LDYLTTRLAAASDNAYKLLAHGRWFSPSTPASSTTKTGHHDIAEILLKVALKQQTKNKNKSKYKHTRTFRHCHITTYELTMQRNRHRMKINVEHIRVLIQRT